MKAIIVGASSGIGLEIAKQLLAEGWYLGIAARREEALLALKETAPDRIEVMTIDITHPDASERLLSLIERLGGMDLYFHSSGIGKQNRTLEPDIDLSENDVISALSRFYFVNVKNNTSVRIDPSAYAADTSLIGEFVRGVSANADYDADRKNTLIALGLKLLSGREVE